MLLLLGCVAALPDSLFQIALGGELLRMQKIYSAPGPDQAIPSHPRLGGKWRKREGWMPRKVGDPDPDPNLFSGWYLAGLQCTMIGVDCAV